ncbi:telomere-protecting terminal protein Tpg [Streptomyces microflavus]|uniref:telomere-protecting terminal protein Tpg n=1 Tax=Streptomyces microflavus TaxID=1919 RepID=UPI0033B2F4DF
MVTVEEELGRAVQQAFTRPVPKSAGARMRYLVRHHQHSTQQVAELLGISRRTVERYVKNQIKHPRPQLATRLENEIRTRWQPQVRARARRQAASTDGIMIDVQARFGDAQATGTDEDQLLQLTAEALGETYFRDNGRRAHGLEVELTDVLDLQFRL